MAPVVGHAPIAISAVIIRTSAVIDRTAPVVDGAAAIVTIRIAVIISGAVLGRGDRKAGPDDTGKSGCRSGTAAAIVPATRAEVSSIAGRGCRRQAFTRWGGPGESQRRLGHRQRHRRNCRHCHGAAVGRKYSFSRKHLDVLRGKMAWRGRLARQAFWS